MQGTWVDKAERRAGPGRCSPGLSDRQAAGGGGPAAERGHERRGYRELPAASEGPEGEMKKHFLLMTENFPNLSPKTLTSKIKKLSTLQRTHPEVSAKTCHQLFKERKVWNQPEEDTLPRGGEHPTDRISHQKLRQREEAAHFSNEGNKNYQPWILHLLKLFFKDKRKIKTF